MAETMSEVSTHDDVVFVAREAAAASDCCEVALPHLPRFPKKGRGTITLCPLEMSKPPNSERLFITTGPHCAFQAIFQWRHPPDSPPRASLSAVTCPLRALPSGQMVKAASALLRAGFATCATWMRWCGCRRQARWWTASSTPTQQLMWLSHQHHSVAAIDQQLSTQRVAAKSASG